MYANIIYNASRLLWWGVSEFRERRVWENFKAMRLDAKNSRRARLCQQIAACEHPGTPMCEFFVAVVATLDARSAQVRAWERRREAAMSLNRCLRKKPHEREERFKVFAQSENVLSDAEAEVSGAMYRAELCQQRVDGEELAAFLSRMEKHPAW